MFDSISNFFSNLLLFSALFCGFTVFIIAIFTYLLFRRLNKFTEPDIPKLKQELEVLHEQNPTASKEKILQKMIHRQALKCGMVGAVTSLGGFYTLPIGLPADILISLRIQTSMVNLIATSYGQTHITEPELKLRNYLITTGGLQISETTSGWAVKFAIRMLEKSFAKFIPLVGAFIGFGVNYFLAQATGNIALRWYSGELKSN